MKGNHNLGRPLGAEEDARRGISTLLVLLCSLTILASLFGIVRGLSYHSFSKLSDVMVFAGNKTYLRGWLFVALNGGTLLGAILMLRRMKAGLHLYSVAQVLYIVLVLHTSYGVHGKGAIKSALAAEIGILFWLPSLVFLVLYWLPVNRRSLR